jgi:hypothetical protein
VMAVLQPRHAHAARNKDARAGHALVRRIGSFPQALRYLEARLGKLLPEGLPQGLGERRACSRWCPWRWCPPGAPLVLLRALLAAHLRGQRRAGERGARRPGRVGERASPRAGWDGAAVPDIVLPAVVPRQPLHLVDERLKICCNDHDERFLTDRERGRRADSRVHDRLQKSW